jgi:hypothetical protein
MIDLAVAIDRVMRDGWMCEEKTGQKRGRAASAARPVCIV